MLPELIQNEIMVANKRCSNCGEGLICDSTKLGVSCWCFAYPSIMSVESQQDCLCESCLSHAIQEKMELINSARSS